MTRLSFVGAVLAAVVLPSASVTADSYPDRPIRAIASQGPGGLSDVFMRALDRTVASADTLRADRIPSRG